MKIVTIILTSLLLLGCNSKKPQTSSKIVNEYILDEKDLVPEGIAYSQKKDAFYLTSIAKSKIIKVDRKTGNQIDFIKGHEYGYSPGAGIFIDDEEDQIHAIGGYYRIKDSLSSLFTFDINTATLLKRYNVMDEGDHFLNDLVKDKKGNLYLTDTKASSVYTLQKGDNFLKLFFKSKEIEFPNGIAISDDDTKLYIASIPNGVRVLDISTKKILNKKDSLGLSQGIDGLEYFKNHLYAIQNSHEVNSFNFRKLTLNQANNEIVGVSIIDSNTPDLNVPLTFCIAQNKAVVIGNSNLQYLNQQSFKFEKSDTIPKTKLLVYTIE